MTDDLNSMKANMKATWNQRAKENAEYFIADGIPEGRKAFLDSGHTDVGFFFQGFEHLLHSEAKVLDIGCGIGRMDRVIAPKVQRVIGVDVSGEMIAKARQELRDVSNVEFMEVSGADLQALEENSFDVVFSYIVFQHVPKAVTRSYVADAYRVLKPRGHLIFQVPEVTGDGSWSEPAHNDTYSLRTFREEEIVPALESLDFSVLDKARVLLPGTTPPLNYLRIVARKWRS